MQQSKNHGFDLEDRTLNFAKNIRTLATQAKKKFEIIEDLKQLLRSSGSVAANYIEANESASKKDFVYRIKICRKEVKESRLWLTLLVLESKTLKENQNSLLKEARELELIFGAILRNST
ncbi:MAG: four helix bundle protein [Candidatus Peribacteraceae bacterium]|jgi:four helix bundle protein|nr:four helix bundle protein [Candidatus Peribacteraceae bacterium]|tara:strand:+ start:3225 stop:3584 length:360 start_codon:yes stop_codon:yes gene_type:complete